MKILIEGWSNVCHSYAVVNYLQVKEMKKHEEHEIFFRKSPFYGSHWKENFDTLDFNNLEVKDYNGEKVDIVYRISFPYDTSPHKEDPVTPVFLFYTSEFQHYQTKNFGDLSLEDLGKLTYLHTVTPSSQSAIAIKGSTVIPHGVDQTQFHDLDSSVIDEHRSKFGILSTDFVFLNVSAMTENKGIKLLIYSFYKLWKQHKNVYLVLKGNDIYHSDKRINQYISDLVFKNLIKVSDLKAFQSKIKIVMELLGFDIMNCLYNVADCYVSTSYAEGFNIPVLEALSCKTPLIIPDGAPMSEMATYLLKTNLQKQETGECFLQIVEEDVYEKLEQAYSKGRGNTDFQLPVKYTWPAIVNEMLCLFEKYVVHDTDEIIMKTEYDSLFNKQYLNEYVDILCDFVKNNEILSLLDVGCLYHKIFKEVLFKNTEYMGVDHFSYNESERVTVRQESFNNPSKVLRGTYDLVLFNPFSVQFLMYAQRVKTGTWYLTITKTGDIVKSLTKGTVLASFDSGYKLTLYSN